MNETEITVYPSKKKFNLLNPAKGSVDIRDIARSLSRQYRFLGYTTIPISVAQHCVMCYEMATYDRKTPLVRMHALMHDASEAYLMDVPAPLKSVLSIGNLSYIEHEKLIMKFIFNELKIEYFTNANTDFLLDESVHEYDRRAYAAEVRDLRPGLEYDSEFAYPLKIRPWNYAEAEAQFLTCWQEVY